ncbi:MAG: ADP-ribosylglycohydrolase family protein [Helicobacteraceae bacterium]|jgi:ADP-ribosylglycohydrolase|nr:ADP-ribosylglycohydrolase family protein [Helicobacteraceae bacterium]
MKNRLEAALWGAFYGDAYALGAHWLYDTHQISKSEFDTKRFNDPLTDYHKGKVAGDFTHYGDQMLWLLDAIANEDEFTVQSFSKRWEEKMSSYGGYIDGASKHTLAALAEGKSTLGCGSSSHDLSVVGRMMPLVYAYHNDMDKMMEFVKLHTVFTHMTKELVESAAYFNELILAVSRGAEVGRAIEEIALAYSPTIQKWVQEGVAKGETDSIEAIKILGQSCSVEGGFAAVIYLLVRFSDFQEAMEANVLAGGDSAARGILVGAVLGAYGGMEVIPFNYNAMNEADTIAKYIEMIDAKDT